VVAIAAARTSGRNGRLPRPLRRAARRGAARSAERCVGWWLRRASGGLPKDGDRAGPFERHSGQIAPITLDESSRPNPTRDGVVRRGLKETKIYPCNAH